MRRLRIGLACGLWLAQALLCAQVLAQAPLPSPPAETASTKPASTPTTTPANTPTTTPAPGQALACPPVAQMPTPETIQASMARATDRGVLWRLRKDGREGWLYGTVHLGKLDWAFPGPRLLTALLSIDTLALELDITDPDTLRRLQPAPGTPNPPLPPALQQRLAQQVQAACLPPDALRALHPVMQAITLASLDARWAGLDPGFAQEAALAGFARRLAKPVVALETPELQLAVLLPQTDQEALHMVDQTLLQLENGASRRTVQRMALAWEAGNLDDLAGYEAWCECIFDDSDRQAMRRLNDDRNPHLADGIAALHAAGKRVLAAVGTLHMTGPQALPLLLKQRGFEVERVLPR